MTNIMNKTRYLSKEVKHMIPHSDPYLFCSHECQLTRTTYSFELLKRFWLEGTSSGSLHAFLPVVQLHHGFGCLG